MPSARCNGRASFKGPLIGLALADVKLAAELGGAGRKLRCCMGRAIDGTAAISMGGVPPAGASFGFSIPVSSECD